MQIVRRISLDAADLEAAILSWLEGDGVDFEGRTPVIQIRMTGEVAVDLEDMQEVTIVDTE